MYNLFHDSFYFFFIKKKLRWAFWALFLRKKIFYAFDVYILISRFLTFFILRFYIKNTENKRKMPSLVIFLKKQRIIYYY